MQLRGASADALAALLAQLGERLQGGSDAARISEDLFTVSSLIRAEPGLRRVSTDVSVEPEAKQRLVESILGGKVDPAALVLVSEAVGRRWTVGRDLADSLEHLAEVAAVRSAGDSQADRLADELFTVQQTVARTPELRDALADSTRSEADRTALVRSLLEGKALPATVALVTRAVSSSYRTVDAALAAYQQVAAEVNGERVATVRTAHALSDADRTRLADALSRQYGREVHLNVVVDPTVLGGLAVEIGDEVIDGTVASRLDDARRKLAG